MTGLEFNSTSTLDAIVSSIGELPAVPVVLNKAIELTSDIETNISDISKVLSADPSLSTRVLRLSNSSYYGRQREVKTVSEAIQVLGFDAIRSVIVAASTYRMFLEGGEESVSKKLWQHSFCTAVGARLLAESLSKENSEVAFVAGLLHDIGKLVVHSRIPASFKMMVKEVACLRGPFCKTEYDVLGFDHCDVGSLLLSRWNFPQELVRPVAKHHRATAPAGLHDVSLSWIIAMADDMSIKLGICFPGQENTTTFVCPDADWSVLSAEQLCDIMKETHRQYEADLRSMEI